jgi:hypothetical protein
MLSYGTPNTGLYRPEALMAIFSYAGSSEAFSFVYALLFYVVFAFFRKARINLLFDEYTYISQYDQCKNRSPIMERITLSVK